MSDTQSPPKDKIIGAAPQVTAPTRSGGTVTVCCKLPNGLQLRNFRMVETQEPMMGGGWKTIKVAEQVGDPVVINGAAHPMDKAPLQQIVGGFALTHGVSADFWESWLAANRNSDVVRNGLIFSATTPDRASDEAREKSALRSGLEGLDPDNLPVRGIETATKKAA